MFETGGKTVSDILINHCRGKYIGHYIYDAHNIPERMDEANYFCFVRRPAHFAHSLWYHRSRKKDNKFGQRWNWQPNELENVCQDSNYVKFMGKVANNPGIVLRY